MGPLIFGCQAPDTGNAEIIAHYGTPEQKERYLRRLLEGEIFSCYSMTEPQAGADPTMFRTRAERDGDEWVINVARQVLRGYRASDDGWPTEHLPRKLAAARAKFAEHLEQEVGNL